MSVRVCVGVCVCVVKKATIPRREFNRDDMEK